MTSSVYICSGVLCCVCSVWGCAFFFMFVFFFQAEDGIRDLVRSRGLGDVYKRQSIHFAMRLSADKHTVPFVPGSVRSFSICERCRCCRFLR